MRTEVKALPALLKRVSLRRLALALAVTGAVADVGMWAFLTLRFGIHTDISILMTFAYSGVHNGWPHLYDWELTRPILGVFGSHFTTNPYPPPTEWLVLPLIYLPYPFAYWLWWVLMLTAILAVWRILAPPEDRVAHLLFMASLLPLGLSLWLGQIVPLIAASVAVAWWLLGRRQDVLAGVVLGAISLKPNLAALAPLALLVGGRWRAAAAAVAVFGALAAVSVWALTPYGVGSYLAHVQQVSLDSSFHLYDPGSTLAGTIHSRPALLIAYALVIAAVCWIARPRARGALELGLAASILGSLLISPYLHPQDLLMLLPAFWLTLKALPARRLAVWLALPIWLAAASSLGIPEILLVWLGGLVVAARSLEHPPRQIDDLIGVSAPS